MDIQITTIGKLSSWLMSRLLKLRRWLLYRKNVAHYLSPEDYFAGFLDRSGSIHHNLPCVGRDEELDVVLEAIDSGAYQAIGISSPPGAGKSRSLLELSRLLRGETRGFRWYWKRRFSGGIWRVYFARRGSTRLLDEIPTLRKGRLAIVFDDAADQAKQVSELLDYASQRKNEGEIVLICAVRSSQIRDLQKAFLVSTPGTTFHQQLAKLGKNGIGEIIDHLLPRAHPQRKSSILSFTQDSVFLAVLVCEALKQDEELISQLADPHFIFRVCIQPMKEAIESSGLPEHVSLNVLASAAALSPLDTTDIDTISQIAEITESTPDDVVRLLDAAVWAGLFERFATSLARPTPELFGTLLIEQACVGEDARANKFANELIARFLTSHPKAIVRNVAMAGWSRGNSLELVKTYIRDLRGGIGSRSPMDEHRCIDLVGEFATVDPVEVTDYLEVLIDYYCNHVVTDQEERDEWKYVFSDVNPILVFCSSLPRTQTKALEHARVLYAEGAISTGYSNRTAEDILETATGFAPLKSVDLNRRALEQIRQWPTYGAKSARAALVACCGLLKYTMDWDESDDFTFRMTSQLLEASEAVRLIRADAIEFICKPDLILTDGVTFELALEVLGSVGEIRGGLSPDPNSNLRRMLESEQLRILRAFDEIRSAQLAPACLVSIENLLWQKWAWGPQAVAEEAERMLAHCDNSPTSRLQRFLLSGDVPASGSEILREYEEGADTRLNCFISEKRDERENSRKLVDQLIDEIGIADVPGDWIQLLEEICDGATALSWRAWQLFRALGSRFPRSAWEIVDVGTDAPWSRYGAQLLSSLRLSDTGEWFLRLGSLPADQGDASLVQWLYAIDTNSFDYRERAFIEALSENTSEKIATALISYLAHSRIEDWGFVAQLLVSLCEAHPTTKNMDETFSFLVHERPDNLKVAIGEVDEKALHLLLSPNRPTNVPWHDPYWAGPFLKLVATSEPRRFLEFLSQSARSMGDNDRYSLQIRGLRNADEALAAALECGQKEEIVDHLLRMGMSDQELASQIGISALGTGFELSDELLQERLSGFIDNGDYRFAAKILCGFPISEEWMPNVRNLIISCAGIGNDLDAVTGILWPAFYTGATRRTPGEPAPKDALVVRKTAEFLQDDSLPALARSYFEELKKSAEESIRSDLDSDERLIGRRL